MPNVRPNQSFLLRIIVHSLPKLRLFSSLTAACAGIWLWGFSDQGEPVVLAVGVGCPAAVGGATVMSPPVY